MFINFLIFFINVMTHEEPNTGFWKWQQAAAREIIFDV